MEDFFKAQFKMLERGIVATPNSREDLDSFAKANGGSMDVLLVQMAVNYGYKIALENVQEELEKVAQMSELYKSWKGKGKKVAKVFSPMVGMVYQGQDKFFGKRVIGILIEMFDQNDEAVLKTANGKVVSVDIKSLKAIICH